MAPTEEGVGVPRQMRRAWLVGLVLGAVHLLGGWLVGSGAAGLLGIVLLVAGAAAYQGSRAAAGTLTVLCALQTIWLFRLYIGSGELAGFIPLALLGGATWSCYQATLRRDNAVSDELPPADAA
jgi:hypothetical protein